MKLNEFLRQNRDMFYDDNGFGRIFNYEKLKEVLSHLGITDEKILKESANVVLGNE